MPYTLMKGLGWFLIALVIGIVIGWLLRSVVARRQVLRARNHHVDSAEMERLRARVADLEPAAADRDRLRLQLDAEVAANSKRLRPGETRGPDVPPPRFTAAAIDTADHDAADHDAADHDAADNGAADDDAADGAVAGTIGEAAAGAPPDVAAATPVLGHAIVLDDLKVVEGIGPKVETLCHGIGIRTWSELSTTEVSLLRTMLVDAGPRFRTHDPSTWPEQAGLLAAGRWVEFKALTDSLNGGRRVDSSDAGTDSSSAE
jgi:predicted flap endonuclease-1-like 5' DNA nuclease